MTMKQNQTKVTYTENMSTELFADSLSQGIEVKWQAGINELDEWGDEHTNSGSMITEQLARLNVVYKQKQFTEVLLFSIGSLVIICLYCLLVQHYIWVYVLIQVLLCASIPWLMRRFVYEREAVLKDEG